MREIITEDLQTKLRTIKRLSFTNKGLETKIFTEVYTDETSIFNSDNIIDDIEQNQIEYVNYDHTKSITEGGVMLYYDYSKESDGSISYNSFNTYVKTEFTIDHELDAKGLVDKQFYFKQSVQDTAIIGIQLDIIEDYSAGSYILIRIGEYINEKYEIIADQNGKFTVPFETLNIEDELGEIVKYEYFIVNNTNPNARAIAHTMMLSVPDAELLRRYRNEEEGETEDV